MTWKVAALAVALWGCGRAIDPPGALIHARFDPDDKVVPMPTDVLRDDTAGHLDLPLDDVTPAEAELFAWMNGLDGWSSAQSAVVELTGAVDPATLTADTLQVWEWSDPPAPVADVTIEVAEDGKTVTIVPPRTGWKRGGRYAILLRGGEAGPRGTAGEWFECDAAFYFLRLTEDLTAPEHVRAFPGKDLAERTDNARKLEDLRVELAPFFAWFEGRGVARTDVAALWAFTVTSKIELAMDKKSQRMPLPFDLLRDPVSGLIDIPVAAWDSEVLRDAKRSLAELDGFSLSGRLTFGFTGKIDPATATEQTIELWRTDPATGGLAEQIPVDVATLEEGLHVELTLRGGPLSEKTRYAVIVREGLRGAAGEDVILMAAGRLIQADAPVVVDGASQVGPLDDADALKVEAVRGEVVPALADARGRGEPVLAAWTFTTMSVEAPFQAWMQKPRELGVDRLPKITRRMSGVEAVLDFPLALGSMLAVDEVVTGTIQSPQFLDATTRALRADKRATIEEIPFTAVVPKNAGPKMPVAIFSHGVLAERRTVLTLANALAQRGIAVVAIDLPMHGERTYCWTHGPISIPNPVTGELTPMGSPCDAGASCSEDGRCVDSSGATQPMATWPIVSMPRASGAAFLEIEKIANTRDHFIQAEIDLTSLFESLREGDWSDVFGRAVDTDRVMFTGMSLGGILGATFVANHPEVKVAVLNVPGANTVDLFQESPFFGPQVSAFFTRERVAKDSYDGHRFMNVAHWFMDAVDPQNFAEHVMDGERDVLIQMATLDQIIPNEYTLELESLSGAPRRDYVAEHAFLCLTIEPEYLRGVNELADFLDGWRP